MRISHKHKFVFISIPKTGSTSIRTALDEYSDIVSGPEYPYIHHITAYELKQHFHQKGWNWDEYFKFAFIRNPWDRLVSFYFGTKPDKNLRYNWEKEWNEHDRIEFTPWLNNLDIVKPQSRFIFDPKERCW